ncbi:hypothetical protein Q4561_05205 [Alteromonas sp. 1_MG-2023]|uniref:hypothetical protein n=1 Tax=Alteromonas sp. 1_MG-2023 TaxID=3062669 RepID=UPI0026E3934E|nr:hypothetical protein [Alteromonas sp. 1_MG-2023]MDO6566446.1 hypothetical protein [Alteromonas sp. 1_MG-2023]
MKKLTLAIVLSSALSTFSFADGNSSTKEHSSKIDTDFAKLDKNGDSLISEDELDANQLTNFLDRIDENGDKAINLNEFNSFVKANPTLFSDDVSSEANDQDATDAVEAQKISEQARSEPDTETAKDDALKAVENSDMSAAVMANFDKSDTNADGSLSKQELDNANIDAKFTDLDTDRNQSISKTELHEYLQQRASR